MNADNAEHTDPPCPACNCHLKAYKKTDITADIDPPLAIVYSDDTAPHSNFVSPHSDGSDPPNIRVCRESPKITFPPKKFGIKIVAAGAP